MVGIRYGLFMDKDIKQTIINNPWIRSPRFKLINSLLKDINVSDVYSEKNKHQLTDVMLKFRIWVSEIIDLSDFQHMYFVNGATDAIHQWHATEKREWQVINGDYTYGRRISQTGELLSLSELSKDRVLYISNPSAIDGNYLDDDVIDHINSIGCPVILDMAYVGATKKKTTKLLNNVEQVWFSFSKGWGLAEQRLGLVFSKTPHQSLEVMYQVDVWNYTGVTIIDKLISNFEVDHIYNLMLKHQIKICYDWKLIPSDTYLIANTVDEEYKERRRNGKNARLCLTPIMYENNIDEIY